MKNDLFVTCAQGLEPLLAAELGEMGFENVKTGFRGVHIPACPMESIYKINYCSRLASRVLLPLKDFRCFEQKSLYKGVSSVDWLPYFSKGKTFAIDANVSHKMLRNSMFAAQVAKDAICDQLRQRTGERPSVNPKNPDIQLNLFIHQNQGIISFDTSGSPLHKRGYRLDAGEAPLQESLAAAILRIAGYQGDEILLDPCCGAGTLLIEAALIASKTPPGYLRKDWGFMHMPAFSPSEWLKFKAGADDARVQVRENHLFGCDVNKNVVRICKGNLRAAGFHQAVDVAAMDFREYVPEILPNLLISNPPHGKRLDDVQSLYPLYRSLGDFMKQRMAKPARGFVFTGSLELSKEVGLAAKRRHVLNNGGVESRLLEIDIY